MNISDAYEAAGIMLDAAAEHADSVLSVAASTVMADPASADGITVGARMVVYGASAAATVAGRLHLADHQSRAAQFGHIHHEWRGVVAGTPATVTAIEFRGGEGQ
jgi:hypothetical protein